MPTEHTHTQTEQSARGSQLGGAARCAWALVRQNDATGDTTARELTETVRFAGRRSGPQPQRVRSATNRGARRARERPSIHASRRVESINRNVCVHSKCMCGCLSIRDSESAGMRESVFVCHLHRAIAVGREIERKSVEESRRVYGVCGP